MFRHLLSLTYVLFFAALPALAAEPSGPTAGDSWELGARKLQQATVTVRIWGESPQDAAKPAAVTVCSGLCVREGRVIIAATVGSDTRIRLTLPGGKQADAKVQIIDEYSGLALLKADTAPLVPLVAAQAAPAVGGELLTAAAWGLDQPLVFRAIVGGTHRKHPGSNYPPLLQCDCLTTPTSTGAGLIDRQGRLVGVIVAADREGSRRG
jgi:S1-C subfamily serine protease